MTPIWPHQLSIIYLVLGLCCAILIAADVCRHPQRMWIMNIVWPVTALFGTVWVMWQYLTYGRLAARDAVDDAEAHARSHGGSRATPFPMMVANGALHCGSGCTLGDIVAEWLVFAVPSIAVTFGYGSFLGDRIFAVWIVGFLFAYGFGVVFQYFTIAPMRGLSLGPGLLAAIKADTLSLTFWQIGMYGFMALAHFYFFGNLLGISLRTNTTEFWFMMQLAMICGFATAYPVNWWLLRTGVKEAM